MEIATEHLLLREFRADDWPAVLACQPAPRYQRDDCWPRRTEPEARACVQIFLDPQQAEPLRHKRLKPGPDSSII
jgi:hypothetical protein